MKKVISIFLLLSILMSGVAVLGEQTSPTQPSIIISALTSPTGVELPEGFVIELLTPSETAQKVFDEIAEFVKDKTASEYFGEEAMTAAATYLPEETDASALVLDELWTNRVLGYDAAYGDAEATFEFVTEYEDDTVLLGMIGVMTAVPEDEPAQIEWTPVKAEAVEGKVKVFFEQELLEKISVSDEVVFALLRLVKP